MGRTREEVAHKDFFVTCVILGIIAQENVQSNCFLKPAALVLRPSRSHARIQRQYRQMDKCYLSSGCKKMIKSYGTTV